MTAVTGTLPAGVNSSKISKAMKALKGGGLLTGAFCLLDFVSVPGAFKLDYNTKGEKVEGLNWESGLKELGKSAVKCASYLAVPALIAGTVASGGVLAAALGGLGAIGSTFALSSIFEKLLPEEQKLVAEACGKKGIDINKEKENASLTGNMNYLT